MRMRLATGLLACRIQELSGFGEEQREAGRIPRTVEVELTADMGRLGYTAVC